MKGRIKPRYCPCGKEIGFGRIRSTYCSEGCRDIYGSRRTWRADMDIESKMDTLRKTSAWARELTDEQLQHWVSIQETPQEHNLSKLHGGRFYIAFDHEFGLQHIVMEHGTKKT